MQTLLPISLWITAAPYGCSASLQMEADRISAYTMKSLVPGLRVLVLGDNQAAVNPVREALQRMDGTLVASSHHLFVAEYKFDLMQSQRRQVALPQIGRQSGADLLVLVDADQRINFPRVVKGIDAETGEILWNGSAARPLGATDTDYDAAITQITRQALMDEMMNPGKAAEPCSYRFRSFAPITRSSRHPVSTDYDWRPFLQAPAAIPAWPMYRAHNN